MHKFFVTGATGVVGSALISELCAQGPVEFQLLVRAKDETDLARRRAAMLRFWEFAEDSDIAQHITMLRGDVTLPNFGLSDEAYAEVASKTTHIVHSAAIVKMNLPMEEARRSAVTSVGSILDLANRCRKHGVLQKVDIVSTVGVSGLTPGVMPEAPMLDVDKFHNTYEASKSEAERYIFANQGELPLTIHRPSMVVGHENTGKIIHFQVFYHLCEFLSGRHTNGFIPKTPGVSLDTIPVSYVAQAIAFSTKNSNATRGQIFHLCSGPDHAIPINELVSCVQASFSSKTTKPARTIPASLFRAALPVMAWFADDREKKALRNLPIFLDYLAVPQGFSNARSKVFFEGVGINLPKPQNYLQSVLNFYLAAKG